MAQMNRSYGSDIQNLLDVALQYKAAKEEQEYRDKALEAEKSYRDIALESEKSYREQKMNQDLNLATLNILAQRNEDLTSNIVNLIPLANKYNIDVNKITEEYGDKMSPDTKEVMATSDNTLNSALSYTIGKIAQNEYVINYINKELAKKQFYENQSDYLFSEIVRKSADQNIQDQYYISPEELQSYLKKNPLTDEPISPEDFNWILGYLNEKGRAEVDKLAKNLVETKEMKDGEVITKFTPAQDLIGKSIVGVPEKERETEAEGLYKVYAIQLKNRLVEYYSRIANKPGKAKSEFNKVFGDFLSLSADRLGVPVFENSKDVEAFVAKYYDPELERSLNLDVSKSQSDIVNDTLKNANISRPTINKQTGKLEIGGF